jgi:hypothetical protein
LKFESVKRDRQTEVALARAAALCRGLEFLAELGEFVGGEIADRPVVQAPVAPAPDVEALNGFGLGGAAAEKNNTTIN